VCPNPRPEIIGTCALQAANMGAKTKLTVSPTPPVECLSITGPRNWSSGQVRTVPESRMAAVSATLSSITMPRRNTAIAKAAICPSLAVPSTTAATISPIAAVSSCSPSRLRRITLCGDWRVEIMAGNPPEQRRLRHSATLSTSDRRIGQQGEEAIQQPHHARYRLLTTGECSFMG